MHKMDHLNSDGYLFSGVYTYQKDRIKLLDNNSIPFPDMAWEIDGEILYDTRSVYTCLLYTSPSPRDQRGSRMPSSA